MKANEAAVREAVSAVLVSDCSALERAQLREWVLGAGANDGQGSGSANSAAALLLSDALERGAIAALIDGLAALGKALPKVLTALPPGWDDFLGIEEGVKFGPFLPLRQISEDPLGRWYMGRWEGDDVMLRVLRRTLTADSGRRARFLAAARFGGSLESSPLIEMREVATVGDRVMIAYAPASGELLSAKLNNRLPLTYGEALPVLQSLLSALMSLHSRGLVHGAVQLGSLWIEGDLQEPDVRLADFGAHHLASAASETLPLGASAPELLLGSAGSTRSDVYAVGAFLFELISGKRPLEATQAAEQAAKHILLPAAELHTVAAEGWVSPELSLLVARLLATDATLRPRDASEVSELLPRVASGAPRIDDDEFTARFQAAYAQPWDEQVLAVLERCVDEGIDPARVGASFGSIAEQFDLSVQPDQYQTWRRLQLKAAGVYESAAGRLQEAATLYRSLLQVEAGDEVASRGLERALRKSGRHEELIEWLLEQQETETSRFQRAQRMAEIGRIYADELNDREQALVAYVEAFEECPQEEGQVRRIEQIAGNDVNLWEKVLLDCTDDISREREHDDQVAFLRQVGDWYQRKLGRGDLATPWFQQTLVHAPHDELALKGLCDVQRKAQRWPELVQLLVARADLPALPRQAAAVLRVEAAEILSDKLNDANAARELCERALADDPQNERASTLLAATFERTHDARGFAALLERQAQDLTGMDKARTLSKAADAHGEKLSDPGNAERLYLEALRADATELGALRGLDRLYTSQGRVRDLLSVIEHQLAAAQTPRQQITLLERKVAIYDEELKDLEQAAASCVSILMLDPQQASARQNLHRFYRSLGRDAELAASYQEELLGDLPAAQRSATLLALGDLWAGKLGNLNEAIACYRQAVQLDSTGTEALQRLYTSQRASDDAAGALQTVAELAQRETTPESQAERLLAAAEILLEQGDSEGAVLQCKLALDADPRCKPARDRLLAIYEERGDHGAIATLLEQQVETGAGAGAHERALVLGKLAHVTWTHLRDEARAFAAATQAVDLDATNRLARLVLAELCYDDSRFAEAIGHYDHVVAQLESLSEQEALRALANYLDSLTQGGNSSKAAEVARKVLQWPSCNLVLLQRAATVLFQWGSPDEAAQAYRKVLAQGADTLSSEEEVEALCRLGTSSHKRGHAAEAQNSFEEALQIDANSLPALEGLAAAHQDAGAWDKAVEVLYRQIDLKTGEEQSDLLLKIGDIATQHLKDTDYAARAYLLAFEGLPDSAPQRRTALAKLMQLYSAERDWGRLLAVIQRLADYVEDKSQKAKYLFTGAKVAMQQVGDAQQAAQMFDRVLELDPHHAESLKANLELRRQLGDPNALKELLKKEVNAASAKQDEARALRALDELAQVYARDLGQMDKAIGALQAACDLEPSNQQRKEALAKCYLDQRAKYPAEALAAYQELLEQQPLAASVHRALRQLHTDARNADAAWCACQTLTALGQATPEEQSFFERRREGQMFAASAAISPGEALEIFLHPGADKDFTRLAGLIQPSVERVRGQTLEQLGYRPEHLVNKDERYPLVSAAHYISQIIGMPPPAILQNQQFEGNLSVLPSTPLCFALGAAGLIQDYPMQAAAFVAGHEMAFGLPGLGVIQLVANHTTLKTWLFGALRIVSPQLGSGSLMPEPLNEASEALHHDLVGTRRDVLVGIATKMTRGAPVDLKKWLASVELTADRMGFFFCNDLTIALEMIQGNHTASQWVSVERRSEELVRYAVSQPYLAARARLGAARSQSSPPLAASAYGAP